MDINYKELYTEGVRALEAAGIIEAALDARLLLENVCDTDRNYLYVHGEDAVDQDKITAYRLLIKKRSERIPLQHILGYQEFMGLRFTVNEHVLIPRQDTECLVEEAMLVTEDGDRVLDMCTGSGCILLSLMHYKNDITGVGADISDEALKVASKNAEELGICAEFIKSDLYDFAGEDSEPFDVIVSNPPYIRPDVIETLEPEVKSFEPRIALDGGGDGLDYYRRITDGAVKYLKKGGYLLYEIGFDQGESVKKIMEEHGFKDVCIVKDLAGLDRVVRGYL